MTEQIDADPAAVLAKAATLIADTIVTRQKLAALLDSWKDLEGEMRLVSSFSRSTKSLHYADLLRSAIYELSKALDVTIELGPAIPRVRDL